MSGAYLWELFRSWNVTIGDLAKQVTLSEGSGYALSEAHTREETSSQRFMEGEAGEYYRK
jgi:hypothetical protein